MSKWSTGLKLIWELPSYSSLSPLLNYDTCCSHTSATSAPPPAGTFVKYDTGHWAQHLAASYTAQNTLIWRHKAPSLTACVIAGVGVEVDCYPIMIVLSLCVRGCGSNGVSGFYGSKLVNLAFTHTLPAPSHRTLPCNVHRQTAVSHKHMHLDQDTTNG